MSDSRTYRVRFMQPVEITVTLAATDDDQAEDQALRLAREYLATVYGDASLNIRADHSSLDGVGAHEVECLPAPSPAGER